VVNAGGSFDLVEEDKRAPVAGYARVKVQACGICHSDALTKEGVLPGIAYPRAPGHEIAGVIDALGDGTDPWQVGDRVGIGWHGAHCGKCDSCRRGDFITCARLQIPGISYDGGYAEFVIAPVQALARIPDAIAPEDAGPLMCAGVTTFNALRNSGARPGDLVAIQGIGGLGHLGVQFASKFGFATVAIGRGAEKKALALKLGARDYIDARAQDVARELSGLGGARVILATAPDGKAMGSLIDGLGVDGKLIIVGASAEPFRGFVVPAADCAQIDCGLAVRNLDGFGGHVEVRGEQRCSTDDRDLSAGASGGGLRTHDFGQSALPVRSEDLVYAG
jgi:D-arabinose 1-dehydrogenase-like Zn-dependent alcohol dehydrogenase